VQPAPQRYRSRRSAILELFRFKVVKSAGQVRLAFVRQQTNAFSIYVGDLEGNG
jgi:hypothetical protein